MAAPETEGPRVGVIGAGAGGLVVARELLARGISVTVFEADEAPGGLFRRCYQGAMLTTSSVWTAFSHYPPRLARADGFDGGGEAERPLHWTAEEYARYLELYAERFGIRPRLRCGARVESCRWDGQGWTVTTSGAGAGRHRFEKLAVATGANQRPRIPQLEGLSDFAGAAIHSSRVRDVEALFSGRRVLIVGGGESAADLALRAQRVAATCAVSVRGRFGHITPRTLSCATRTRELEAGGEPPADTDINLVNLGLPTSLWALGSWKDAMALGFSAALPDMGGLGPGMVINLTQGSYITRQFGTKTTGLSQALAEGAGIHPGLARLEPGAARFVDGARYECDVVVFATGYESRLPFLEGLDPALPATPSGGLDSRGLFKHMLHPDWGTALAFVGYARPAFGTIPGACELQARYFAALVAGERALPDPAIMAATIARDAAAEHARYWSAPGLPPLTDFASYLGDLGALLGSRPGAAALLRARPRLLLRSLVCQHGAGHYRLIDQGPDGDTARETLRRQITVPSAAYDLHLFLICALASGLGWSALRPATLGAPTRRQRIALWSALPLWAPLALPSLYLVAVIALYRLLTPYHWLHWLGRLRGRPAGVADLSALAGYRSPAGWLLRLTMIPLTVAFIAAAAPVFWPTMLLLMAAGIRVVTPPLIRLPARR